MDPEKRRAYAPPGQGGSAQLRESSRASDASMNFRQWGKLKNRVRRDLAAFLSAQQSSCCSHYLPAAARQNF